MDETYASRPAPHQSAGPDDSRRGRYPRELARLLPPIVKSSLGKSGGVLARLALDWAAIAGPRLARETAPRRLAQSCLTIACAGPMALELQHLAPALLERINRHYGRPVASRLRFIQAPVAAPLLALADAPRPALPRARVLAGLSGPLHDALASLGQHIEARELDARERARHRVTDDRARPAGPHPGALSDSDT